MSAIIKFSYVIQVEQASAINRNNVEVQGVLFDGLYANVIGFLDIVLSLAVFGFDAQKIDIIFFVKYFIDGFSLKFLILAQIANIRCFFIDKLLRSRLLG
jgi:hypothetical protein